MPIEVLVLKLGSLCDGSTPWRGNKCDLTSCILQDVSQNSTNPWNAIQPGSIGKKLLQAAPSPSTSIADNGPQGVNVNITNPDANLVSQGQISSLQKATFLLWFCPRAVFWCSQFLCKFCVRVIPHASGSSGSGCPQACESAPHKSDGQPFAYHAGTD